MAAPGDPVPREAKAAMMELAKRELDGRGYVLRLSTARDGENLVGRVEVTDVATDKIVARFVGIGKFDNLEVVVGLDAMEGIAKDLLSQVMNLADILRYFIPGASLREE
jgi:hypothetical protein